MAYSYSTFGQYDQFYNLNANVISCDSMLCKNAIKSNLIVQNILDANIINANIINLNGVDLENEIIIYTKSNIKSNFTIFK